MENLIEFTIQLTLIWSKEILRLDVWMTAHFLPGEAVSRLVLYAAIQEVEPF
jgi:hypothetical protein